MRRNYRGFTLVELMFAVAVAAAAIAAGFVVIGRVLVDDGDAIHALQTQKIAGPLADPKIVSRHNVIDLPYRGFYYGCDKPGDAVAFDLQAKSPEGKEYGVTVCCGAWFKGCAARSVTPLKAP